MSDVVVIEEKEGSISELWLKEDYWSIWLGFIILIVGCCIYFNNQPAGMDSFADQNAIIAEEEVRTSHLDEKDAPTFLKTVEYYQAIDEKKSVKASSQGFAKKISGFFAKPGAWTNNPIDSFYLSQAKADMRNEKRRPAYEAAKAKTNEQEVNALMAQEEAAEASFQNLALNKQAELAIGEWRKAVRSEASAKKKLAKPYNKLPNLIGLCIVFSIFFGIGMQVMKKEFVPFVKGFWFVFMFAMLAYTFAAQSFMKSLGIDSAIWAIFLGMLVANTIGTPSWAKPALMVEYFIKTGLVLLGAEILFNKIVAIGLPGIFIAWVVTPTVLICTYIFGQKVIKMPSKTLNMVISADMSVCGTSAAIAVAAACRAKKEELTLSIGLSLVFTSIMMIAMPAFIKAVGMPYALGGAWMGGTIDATGAVAAAGAFLSEEALYVAATIKMIQNVLIGVIAFGVAVYWSTRVDVAEGRTVGAMEIWYRFPKFVLGFLAASIIFSLLIANFGADKGYSVIEQGVIGGWSKLFRGWFFALSFAAIGLATNFRELAHHFKGGKPFILYACGQTLNLTLTLIMAYIMFYVVFPDVLAQL